METWRVNLRSTEWPFTPSELFRHRAALSTPCKRQQMNMKKNTEVLLQVQCTKTSTWTTASVLLAPKLKPRNRSKVCVKCVQKVDFASLRSSATNGVSESIPKEESSKDVKTLDLNYDELPIERALGVQWCVKSDTFRFRITIKDKPLMRRGILSIVSSTYDPLGFAAPSTFKAKKLHQDVYKDEKLGWDDKLPESYWNCWENWRNELPMLEHILVPHCVKPIDFGEMKTREVHIFSDWSCIGYGSVAYLHLSDNEDRIHCSFLMGKARVTPIKAVTIPRL